MSSGSEALSKIASGDIDFYLCPTFTALPLIREGKVVALAVSGAKRAPELPDVPTTLESGFTDADYTFWVGLFAPAKTPRDIVQKLHDETAKIMQAAAVAEKLTALGVVPMPLTSEQFDSRIRDELASNATLLGAVATKAQ